MIGIILEGVLFVALIATMAALLFYALVPSGTRICPACYKEALHE